MIADKFERSRRHFDSIVDDNLLYQASAERNFTACVDNASMALQQFAVGRQQNLDSSYGLLDARRGC